MLITAKLLVGHIHIEMIKTDANSAAQKLLGSIFPVEMCFTYKTLFRNFFQVF